MFIEEKRLREMMAKRHSNMQTKARPRPYKSGRMKGQLRKPGLDRLPFTPEDLWKHVYKQVGPGAIPCPYCVIICKPVTMIDLISCELDHKIPHERGTSKEELLKIHSLDNIVAVCRECNGYKGPLSYEFFIALMSEVYKWEDERDRKNLLLCLKTHGKVRRSWGDKGKKKDEVAVSHEPLKLDLSGFTKGVEARIEDW